MKLIIISVVDALPINKFSLWLKIVEWCNAVETVLSMSENVFEYYLQEKLRAI